MSYAVSCQYAHNEHSESVDLGSMGAVDVLRAFDRFDWSGQVAEANRLQSCSPTLSVEDKNGERLIWVSAYGDPGKFAFVSECRFPGVVSMLFGLLKRQGAVNLHTNDFSFEAAREALERFLGEEERGLRSLYAGAWST